MDKQQKIQNFLNMQSKIEGMINSYFGKSDIGRWRVESMLKELLNAKYLKLSDIRDKNADQVMHILKSVLSKYAIQISQGKEERNLYYCREFLIEDSLNRVSREILESHVIKFLNAFSMKEAENVGGIAEDTIKGNYKLLAEDDYAKIEEFIRDNFQEYEEI